MLLGRRAWSWRSRDVPVPYGFLPFQRTDRTIKPWDQTTSPTFNVFHSDPGTTLPADYRIDLCVGTERPIEAHGERIEAGNIPGGRCAVLRVVGNTDNLEPAALYLYRDWRPVSGEEARDCPLYCQRLAFFPEVPEHEAVADLFLPLK